MTLGNIPAMTLGTVVVAWITAMTLGNVVELQ